MARIELDIEAMRPMRAVAEIIRQAGAKTLKDLSAFVDGAALRICLDNFTEATWFLWNTRQGANATRFTITTIFADALIDDVDDLIKAYEAIAQHGLTKELRHARQVLVDAINNA